MRRIIEESSVRDQNCELGVVGAVPVGWLLQTDPVIAARIEIVSEIIRVCAGKARAGREAAKATGLFLPNLQGVQREILFGGAGLPEIETELAIGDTVHRSVRAVTDK